MNKSKEEDVNISAVIETNKGDIDVSLFCDEAPVTVASWVNLAERGFYNGVTFHRVVPDFVIQGGDPDGKGHGGPGYQFEDECSPKRKHDAAGVLSMANAGAGTNGSQFFITHQATPHLDGKHTVFGKVTSGLEVVNAIRQGDRMKSVRIEGDSAELLTAQKKRVDEWNKVLDRKYPRK